MAVVEVANAVIDPRAERDNICKTNKCFSGESSSSREEQNQRPGLYNRAFLFKFLISKRLLTTGIETDITSEFGIQQELLTNGGPFS